MSSAQAYVVSHRRVLAGKRREHGGAPCHEVADAQLEAIPVRLAPELEDQTPVARGDGAGVVEDPGGGVATNDRAEKALLETKASTARRRRDEGQLRRGCALPAARSGPVVLLVEEADGKVGKTAAMRQLQSAGDCSRVSGDDACTWRRNELPWRAPVRRIYARGCPQVGTCRCPRLLGRQRGGAVPSGRTVMLAPADVRSTRGESGGLAALIEELVERNTTSRLAI